MTAKPRWEKVFVNAKGALARCATVEARLKRPEVKGRLFPEDRVKCGVKMAVGK